jgi:hypothetical protein
MLALEEEMNLYSKTLMYFTFLSTVTVRQLSDLCDSRSAKK